MNEDPENGEAHASHWSKALKHKIATLPDTSNAWGVADHRGGEGVDLLLKLRSDEKNEWIHTLFAWRGRTISWDLMFIYSCCVVAVVVPAVMLFNWSKPSTIMKSMGDLKTPLSFSGTCLFFLLVFRNNNSYGRWWEGRLQWGAVTAACRRLARKTARWVKDDLVAARIINWTACYGIALKQHLRGEKEPLEFAGLMTPEQIEDLMASPHMPLRILDAITDAVTSAHEGGAIAPPQMINMEVDIGALSDGGGACERIMKTPMPFIYVVHLRTIMAVWLLTMPFAMVPSLDWLAIPVSVMIGFFLIGLDDAACELENPFGSDFNDLPLDGVTSGIRSTLMEIKQLKVEKKLVPAAAAVVDLSKAAAAALQVAKGVAVGIITEKTPAASGGLLARIKAAQEASAPGSTSGTTFTPPGVPGAK